MSSINKIYENSRSYGDLERRTAAKNIPLYAHIDLTYRCNLKCVHCYAVNENSRKELSTDEVKTILDQLAEAGSLYLALSGGEALLRKDFFDICHYARSKGFALRLLTNGILITSDSAQQIADLYPLFVEISLYAMSEKIHDSITQVTGSFARTLAAIRHLRKLKMNVHIKTIIMKQNINELISLQQFANLIGATFRPDVVINPKTDTDQSPLEFRIGDDDLAWYFEEMNLEWKTQQPVLHETLCNAGKNLVVISPFGDVYPCTRIQNNAGNLRDQSFHEIWSNSLVLKHIRELTLTTLNQCATCDDMGYCNPCPGLALMEHGNLHEPAQECCRQARIRKSTMRNEPLR